MKKVLLSLVLLAFLTHSQAQVQDISFTFSPNASFIWWNDHAGLDNSMGFGANVGFGFGEFVELKATYMQTNELATSFEDFGLPNFNSELFESQNVDLKRWGGEIRTNFGTKKFTPYFLVGTGVQTIDVENNMDNKQIYTALGAGLKLNFGHRTAFTVEAKNTSYKYNAVQYLLTDQNKTDFGIDGADYTAERIGNWSFETSLQFYLGGTTPGEMSDLDKAYRSSYQHGFEGGRWVFEPAVAHINFDKNSQFRDAYFIGAYTGYDFNEYVGLRVFYFQAVRDKDISDGSNNFFDDFNMYGGEFRAKFNTSMGVTPYLSLGGGYLNPKSDYIYAVEVTDGEGDLFASGGLGINIPIAQKVELFGSANYMLTSGTKIGDVNQAQEIQSHTMFNAGLKISLGKQADTPDEVYARETEAIRNQEKETYEAKLTEMKLAYLEEISDLEDELDKAYAEDDSVRAQQIEADMRRAENRYSNLDSRADSIRSGEIMINMSPEQFERLIRTILQGLKDMKPEMEQMKESRDTTGVSMQNQQLEEMNVRMKSLEENLIALREEQGAVSDSAAVGTRALTTSAEPREVDEDILRQLESLQEEFEKLSDDVTYLQREGSGQPVVVNPGQQQTSEPIVLTQTVKEDGTTEVSATEIDELKEGNFDFRGVSGLAGINLGGQFTFNIGVRAHMPIVDTKMELMPELFYGFGDKSSLGIVGNVVYPLKLNNDQFKPYAGGGIGIWKIDGKSNLGLNLVAGTYFDVLGGKMFGDISLRALKHFQFGVGYTFDF
jgi:hypothetical protein